MRRMDMKEKHVMDIMIPLKDYAVVSQDATIEEALKITEESYKRLSPEKYKHQGILGHAIHTLQTSGHRGLLVTGEGKKPIGMLRLTDIYQLVKETIIED